MLGGFAPLPLRLVADELSGLSAAQHARLSNDLKAAVKACPFAVLTYLQTASTVTLEGYLSMVGDGAGVAPTLARSALGTTLITWAQSYEDDYGNQFGFRPRAVMATPQSGASALCITAEVTSPTTVVVKTRLTNAGLLTDARVTLAVW